MSADPFLRQPQRQSSAILQGTVLVLLA